MAASSLWKEPYDFVKAVVNEFLKDDCMQWAAALAYYTAFSLPPLLVIVIAISSLFVEADTAKAQVKAEMQSMISEDGAEQVSEMLSKADRQDDGWLSSILGFVALLFGATGAMAQLQAAFNRVWEVEPDPETGGLINFLMKRIFSFGVILVIAFLLLVSLLLNTILTAFQNQVTAWLPPGLTATMMMVLTFLASSLVVVALFALMFKYLPDIEIGWKDVLAGAVFTTILFMIGKWALGFYLGNSSVGSAYGQAKSLVLIFLWAYYNAIIVLLGAEFTEVWARRFGGIVKPAPGAVRAVRETTHVRQGLGEESREQLNAS